jgi:hypothetical protein
MYFPSLMLMALDEDRVRDLDRRAPNAALRALQRGRARRRRARSWGTRARTALRPRSAPGAAGAGAGVAGARS